MRTSTLLARNLTWYWRTNLAVLLGVATAAGVLGGALLVGDSVQASLRGLVLVRLGNAEFAITRNGFFREELSTAFPSAAAVVAMDGIAIHEASGRRAGGVQVYGIDERFWKFQGEPGAPPRGRDILLTSALAKELGAKAGDDVLLRVEKPSAIPLETLHGRKEDVGRTIRLAMSGVARSEFSLQAGQGDVRAVYVPLARLQRDLNQTGRVNTILAAGTPGIERILKERYTLADLGLKLRVLDQPGCLSLESDSAIISDTLAAVASSTAASLGLRTQPVLTYLANSIRAGDRATPYSVVTALDSDLAPSRDDGIALNDWAARDLEAKVGDPVTLEYYVWKPDGRLETETAQFRVERIVPLAGAAADREFAPAYPGITESASLHDWDPPFPLNMALIRPIDEQYWRQYRTTPKAFVRLARGRELWGTRFGSLTSIRVFPPSEAYGEALRAALDPAAMGLTAVPVKAQGLEAARGTTDFGEYFVYFSFFLMVSALLLTGLFFKLGVEQRTREIGVLRSLGFSASKIRALFVIEGAALAVTGAVAGIGVALAYGAVVMLGLRTWWFDAVGTRLLTLHVSLPSLAAGALAGVVTGLGAIVWTLRRLQPVTPRGLLAGEQKIGPGRWRVVAGAIAAFLALALVAAAWHGNLGQTAGFFGAGALLLIAALLFESAWLHARGFARIGGKFTLGLRSVTYRPGRSILCISLIASATFVIVSLDAFRREGPSEGTGGFPLLAESALPLIHNPNTAPGREALNVPPLEGVEFVSFRLRPGDDASCLNLYQPRNPRVLAPPAAFLRNARFTFQGAVSQAQNPWLLLESKPAGGVIPAIADANSMTYVLHLKLGEEFEFGGVRFRIVAALQDSLFQGELLISEQNFQRLFPDAEGYRFFLLNAPPGKGEEVTRVLEESLSDYGFDVQPAAARLAGFHRVENTYLSIFRALGGLGLILGTVGFAAVLLRNVLERRRELALLRAVGYRPRHLAAMVLAENAFLLLIGLATGAACAVLAIAPAVSMRGGRWPVISLGVLLALVLVTGIAASLAATAAALRSPLLDALRSE
jgi:ABC-type antimicrobial peptide transport system permease subunit